MDNRVKYSELEYPTRQDMREEIDRLTRENEALKSELDKAERWDANANTVHDKWLKAESDLSALRATVAGFRSSWHDFKIRLVETYGGPSPYLDRVMQEIEAAFPPEPEKQEK